MDLREHSSSVGDGLPLASGVVLEVGNGGPVAGLVGCDSTRSAVGLDKGVIVDSLTKACEQSPISLSFNLQGGQVAFGRV